MKIEHDQLIVAFIDLIAHRVGFLELDVIFFTVVLRSDCFISLIVFGFYLIFELRRHFFLDLVALEKVLFLTKITISDLRTDHDLLNLNFLSVLGLRFRRIRQGFVLYDRSLLRV